VVLIDYFNIIYIFINGINLGCMHSKMRWLISTDAPLPKVHMVMLKW
jgi:hypothetical protein